MSTKTVPAHSPSKADPVAVVLGLALTILAHYGLELDEDSARALLEGVLAAGTIAAAVRTWWQRRAARKG